MRLQPTDAGVQMHEVCCDFLEMLACYDQLNIPNLGAGEQAARQLQLVEERHKDRCVGAEQAESIQDAHLFV